MNEWREIGTIRTLPARAGGVRDWQRWAPYAALAWSLVYAALGVYWAVSGRGFPYGPDLASDASGPILGRFGPGVAWIVVAMAGIPAAALAAAMGRGMRSRALRWPFVAAGALLAGVLLLLMTSLNLLVLFGYIPYTIVKFLTGSEFGQSYLAALTQGTVMHQVLCLIGGFFWLAATVSYARRSGDACLYCGRGDGPEGWTSPGNAARWGRIAVYVSLVAPVIYALTRFAWALGIPLGMSEGDWRSGQERGMWTSGLFLAAFGLVGAALTLGLVQRWGETFPRWMIGLAGRRVPVALAVVPALVASVLLMVGGIAMWSSYAQTTVAAKAAGQNWGIFIGPVALFPVWAASLAVAALGYYFRRRGPCRVCGRGASCDSERENIR